MQPIEVWNQQVTSIHVNRYVKKSTVWIEIYRNACVFTV